MPTFEVTIHCFRKAVCLNPEEPATKAALHKIGFPQVQKIRMGRCFILATEVADARTAQELAERACVKFLTNTVTEGYEVKSVIEVAGGTAQ